MRKRSVMLLGLLMVAAGSLYLLGSLLHFDAGLYFWPLALIVLGVWFLLRPAQETGASSTRVLFIGDIKRSGAWQVADEEIISFISDVDLDLTQAQVPDGETDLVCSGFVSDISARVPADIGVKISTSGFICEHNVLNEKSTWFLNPASSETPGYIGCQRRVHIHARGFVVEAKVKAA